MYTFIVFITLLLFLQNDDMSHNMVLSRVSLGCCINLHCAMLHSVHWSSPIEPSLSKWICRKKSAFSIKNTDRRAEIFLFSFFLSFNLSWVYLFETDWANVQTKLLICATNVQRCNVEDGKARWFICSVFNDCLAPLASVSLQGCNKKTKHVKRLLFWQTSICHKHAKV